MAVDLDTTIKLAAFGAIVRTAKPPNVADIAASKGCTGNTVIGLTGPFWDPSAATLT